MAERLAEMNNPITLPRTTVDRLMLTLSQIKNGCRTFKDLHDTTGHAYATIQRDFDRLTYAGVCFTEHPKGGIRLQDQSFSSDELQRMLSNAYAAVHCFKPKFNGRYFNDRLVGGGRNAERRIGQLIRSFKRFDDTDGDWAVPALAIA